MTIIADSGSTKTAWTDVPSGKILITEGLNPHFTTDEKFLDAANKVREALGAANEVYFYGAGLGSEEQRRRYKELATDHFHNTTFHFLTDMVGACRATCQDEAAIVGILGTGSNCCYYNGNEITLKSLSTGYILGDHGSANHVGRLLLQDYLTGEMPEGTVAKFKASIDHDANTIVTMLYSSTTPNRILAQFGKFAALNMDDNYCRGIIIDSLEKWYKYQLKNIVQSSRCNRVRIVGSFGKALEPLLAMFLKRKNLHLETVMASPIEGLVYYHCRK